MSEFRRRLLVQSKNDNPILDNYLTIVAMEDGLTAKLSLNACEYCVDGNGIWKTLPADTETQTINAGQTLSFRGNLTPTSSNGIGTFTVNKYYNLQGNAMSLLFGNDGKIHFSLEGMNGAFRSLFEGSKNLIDVSELVLQASILSTNCYAYMFKNCTAITLAPKLPAMTLADNCYNGMFMNCTNLTSAPELPSMTLANECYSHMFYNCASLTNASELPATTLKSGCYRNMFYNCASLTKTPDLPATILEPRCYEYMFCYCRNLTNVPDLPATTLVLRCYYNMFNKCSELAYIKMLATDISAQNCLDNWVDGIASSGTFVKNRDAIWDVRGVNGIPEGWTVITE